MTDVVLAGPALGPSPRGGASRWARPVAIAASLLAHVAVVHAARHRTIPEVIAPRRTITVESIARPKPAPPPPEAAPDPPAPAATSPLAPHAPARPAATGRPAAAAGKVMLAAGTEPGPADFTMVTGEGIYAGGVTTSSGTSRAPADGASPGAPPPTPVATPATPAAAAPRVDRSSRARLRGVDWGCSALFPANASRDEAWVSVVVTVRPDGTPESVAIASDPGEGFGAAARACALRQRFEPARDPEGAPVPGRTAPVRVHFTR